MNLPSGSEIFQRRTRGLLNLIVLAGVVALVGGCAVHPKGTCGPSCIDIKAATKISLSTERLAMLQKIAQRKYLGVHEQTYLVNAICWGGFGGEQADALIALIHNPTCAEETRQYIRDQLQGVMYSSERKRVAEALAQPPRSER